MPRVFIQVLCWNGHYEVVEATDTPFDRTLYVCPACNDTWAWHNYVQIDNPDQYCTLRVDKPGQVAIDSEGTVEIIEEPTYSLPEGKGVFADPIPF